MIFPILLGILFVSKKAYLYVEGPELKVQQ